MKTNSYLLLEIYNDISTFNRHSQASRNTNLSTKQRTNVTHSVSLHSTILTSTSTRVYTDNNNNTAIKVGLLN